MSKDEVDPMISDFYAQIERVRPVTRRLIDAIMLDTWPNHTAIVDFGIDSQQHYEALYYPIREGEILPQALDEALGHGEKLTVLTREAASNPHKEIAFHTSWDVMLGRPPLSAEQAIKPIPSPSEIARDTTGPSEEQANGQGPETSRRRGQ
jgi:hypothetical protein